MQFCESLKRYNKLVAVPNTRGLIANFPLNVKYIPSVKLTGFCSVNPWISSTSSVRQESSSRSIKNDNLSSGGSDGLALMADRTHSEALSSIPREKKHDHLLPRSLSLSVPSLCLSSSVSLMVKPRALRWKTEALGRTT